MRKRVVPLRPRVAHVSREQIEAHPHALLLALAQHVLLGLRQSSSETPTTVPPYSADPDAFARQMGVFDRMRDIEQRAAQPPTRQSIAPCHFTSLIIAP